MDTSDWAGLISYADLGPLGERVVLGFRDNYAPGAVSFTPGTNPEASR